MTDIVEKLRQIAETKRGAPMPECLRSPDNVSGLAFDDDWATPLSIICGNAVAEIESLRAEIAQLRAVAGAVSVESFNYADLKRDLRNKPDPEW